MTHASFENYPRKFIEPFIMFFSKKHDEDSEIIRNFAP
jgi:hypothetical protein